MDWTYQDVAKMIDHSLLNPSLTDDGTGGRLPTGAGLRRRQRLHHAVLPEAVRRPLTRQHRDGQHDDRIPARRPRTSIKQAEAEQAILDGCQELDMVVNISQVPQRPLGLCAAAISRP